MSSIRARLASSQTTRPRLTHTTRPVSRGRIAERGYDLKLMIRLARLVNKKPSRYDGTGNEGYNRQVPLVNEHGNGTLPPPAI